MTPRQSENRQPALFDTTEPPETFKKAAPIIQSRPINPITLVQRKAMNALMHNALGQPPVMDDGVPVWEISIAELEKTIGFNSKNRAYSRKALRDIASIQFDWDILRPGGPTIKVSVLFPELELNSHSLRYQISKSLRDHVLNPEQYALLDMVVIRKFRRASSLALYELVMKYIRVQSTGPIPVAELRDMMLGKTDDDSLYADYKHLSAKVIKPSVAEINAVSDLTITDVIPQRTGRLISHLTFKMEMKKHASSDIAEKIHGELLAQVKSLGVKPTKASSLLGSYGAEKVAQAYQVTMRRVNKAGKEPLERPDMYFQHALKEGWGSDVDEVAIKPKAPAKPSKNIRDLYSAQMREEVERDWKDFPTDRQNEYIAQYNAQQEVSALKIKATRTTRAANAAFFTWLTNLLRGEPTPEVLLAFADKKFASMQL